MTIIETESVQRIRESALACIQRTGILGLRVAEVAKGADVSVALVYKYFGDRDGLLADVLGDAIERQFQEELNGIEALLNEFHQRVALDEVLALMPKPDDAWRYARRWMRLEAKAASREIPVLRERIGRAIGNVQNATAELITKAREVSGNDSQLPAQTLAWLIIALSDGFANSDLTEIRLSDEDYMPLLDRLLRDHVF